jgi:hypothetical protein
MARQQIAAQIVHDERHDQRVVVDDGERSGGLAP